MSAAESDSQSSFSFPDDSRYAVLSFGPSFSTAESDVTKRGIEGLRQMVAAIPERGEIEWREPEFITSLVTDSRVHEPQEWELSYEESITYPKYYRALLLCKQSGERHRLEVLDSFTVLPSRYDLADVLPESIYGAMIGFAAGMTEAKTFLTDAFERAQSAQPDTKRQQEWRAPRFCFSLRTATGSPFAERWSFAIQESSSMQPKRFRLWVEQQRAGREIYLLRKGNGSLEGIHEIETLPAAVHGAAVGMVLGIWKVQRRLESAAEKGEVTATQNSYKCFHHENREEAEAVLENYMAAIRAKQGGN